MAQLKGDHSKAVAAYTTALEIEPSAFALGRRAEAHWSLGNAAAALSDSAAALKLKPGWTDLYRLRANDLRSEGRKQEALAEADAAAAAKDRHALAIAAALYDDLGENARAMQAYDRAIALKPEAYIYLNRALHRPRPDRAGRRADLEAALKLEPNMEEAMGAKADLQVEEGDLPGAIATYSTAIAAASPREPRFLALRGIAYSKAGDSVRARRDFAAATAKAKDGVGFNGICWSKARTGVALESALADCDSALAMMPGNPAFLDSRGLVLLRLGRLDEAIAEYGRALAANPRLSFSLYGRGVAWARKGEKSKSETDIAAALKINPGVQASFEEFGVKLEP